jgi:AraC family transcriptional regulator
MTMAIETLATGAGWQVSQFTCSAGADDPVFEEAHERICIAAVIDGTFRYRTSQGQAVLAPGALLLGNQGASFECGHDHGVGDHCIAFHFDPDYFEGILSGVPGARQFDFALPHLPPAMTTLASIVAAGQATDPARLEEIGVDMAAGAIGLLIGPGGGSGGTNARSSKKVAEIIRFMETHSASPIVLSDLAKLAGMSRYHFLRVFRAATGVTPYQFLLNLRLKRAAHLLRGSGASVADIALDCGFGDISEFNRRFRSAFRMTPRDFGDSPNRLSLR